MQNLYLVFVLVFDASLPPLSTNTSATVWSLVLYEFANQAAVDSLDVVFSTAVGPAHTATGVHAFRDAQDGEGRRERAFGQTKVWWYERFQRYHGCAVREVEEEKGQVLVCFGQECIAVVQTPWSASLSTQETRNRRKGNLLVYQNDVSTSQNLTNLVVLAKVSLPRL